MSARYLTHRAASAPLSRCQTFLSLSDQSAYPTRSKRLWGDSIRHPRGAALSFPAGLRPSHMLDTLVSIILLQSLALPDAEGIEPTTLASQLSIAHSATGVRAQAGGGENREPVATGKSNVRHIRGILPIVYKQRVMDISTKTANEIMFATGNANKLREVFHTSTKPFRSL